MKPVKALMLLFLILPFITIDAAAVRKAGKAASGTVVEFDHLNDSDFVEYSLTLAHGQVFVISIINTLPSRFTYEIEALERPVPPAGFSSRSGVSFRDLLNKRIPRVHDERYAGYIVHINHDGPPIEVTLPDQSQRPLHNATIKIAVKTAAWDYEVSGAFTVTGLRDPVFALEKRTENDVEKTFVIRDRDAEDTQDLGLGAFIHVFHSRFSWLAATFGMGLNDGNRTTYYAGPTVRLGNKAALSFGAAAGSVSRLPAGVAVDKPVTDANILNNLGTRIDRSWFVGFSYTFLNPGINTLKKPFAGETTTPQTPPPSDDDNNGGNNDGGNNNGGNNNGGDNNGGNNNGGNNKGGNNNGGNNSGGNNNGGNNNGGGDPQVPPPCDPVTQTCPPADDGDGYAA